MADVHPTVLLKTAVDNGRIDVLRSLLDQLQLKKDFHEIVDAIYINGGTLLHYVTENGYTDAARTLLSSGANPCVQNDNGRTPLQLTQREEIKNVYVQELLQAVAQSKLGRVCQLLSAGVAIDSVDGPSSRNSVLHWAASFGNEDVVRVLCEGGCNVNARNAKGDTPLHDGVRRGDAKVVKKLLRYGADPSSKNAAKEDCFDLAAKKPELLQCLSIHNVAERVVHRSNSVQSNESEMSIASNTSFVKSSHNNSMTPSPKSPLQAVENGSGGGGRMFTFQNINVEKWHDLLWPRPQYLHAPDVDNSFFALPDRKLRVFLLAGNEFGGAEFLSMWNFFVPSLAALRVSLEIEYEMQKCNAERGSGLCCGVFSSQFRHDNFYQLRVNADGVELLAKDRVGLAYGLTTLVQCLRIAYANAPPDGVLRLPPMCVKDWPDTKYRSILADFTGCRVFTVDTLCKIASGLASLKANQLIVHFEIRIQDPFALPYNQKEIYHLRRFCDERNVELVPSLDLNCEEVDTKFAQEIVFKFLERFVGATAVHFGANLSRFLTRNVDVLTYFVPCRLRRVYVTLKDANELTSASASLPPQCTLSLPVSGITLSDERLTQLCNGSHSIALRFANCDIGYLCQAPEEMMKNSLLAAQLGDKCQATSIIACDFVSGCEIVPRSFSFLPELAVLGAAWNRRADVKRYFFLLPHLAAEHVCADRKMTPLFQEILVMGHLEHELTKMMATPAFKNNRKTSTSSNHHHQKTLSVFIQLLLNPDFIDLELLTPVAFKKVRIELQRSLQALNNLKRELPYNYELALTVAEVQLIDELMILASKIGQSLCLVGANPRQDVGVTMINVGVANLLLTSRTDLANKLLEIRTQFQHTWLSRNLPETLPNVMKIFDNLFKTLLPPALQQYGEKLL